MNSRHYNLLGYALTFMGYFTLTISLPLITTIAKNFGMNEAVAHYGIGILFFMFSLSAIVLCSLADMLSTFVVLKYAQIISIVGLLILCLCYNQTSFMIGCFFIGAGTGSYSSNARAIISRHALDIMYMKNSFSTMSLLIVLAPVLSFYLALSMIPISWRLAYAITAGLETILLVYAYWVLSYEDIAYRHNQFLKLLEGFTYCLREKIFLLNGVCIGIEFSIFMQLFMTNIHPLLTANHVPQGYFYLLLLLLSGFYMGGILLFKAIGIKLTDASIRINTMLLLLIGIFIFTLSHSAIFIMIGIYIICAGLGFLVPFTTGSGMAVIKRHHGSAAAIYTFSFACISGIWSVIQAHLVFSTKDFMDLGLWVSYGIVLIIFVTLTIISQ